MTKIAILDSKKQKTFDAPPRLKKEDRSRYFTLTNDLRHSLFNGLRLPINQLGFILQLGYFRASGQFYAPEQFHKRDINHVARTLKFTTVDIAQYNESTRKHHRNLILVHSGWRLPSTEDNYNLNNQAKWYIEQQLSPIKVLQTLVEFCWHHHIVIPSYSKFSDIISRHYNEYEDSLLLTLQRTLTLEDKARLDCWFYAPDAKAYDRPPITELRSINQSVSPGDIQKNVATFNSIKSAYEGFDGVMDILSLTDQANEYFATWVQKAQTFQLTSFADRHKSYLHILAYLKHQYYLRQDTLIDIFLKSTLSARSQLQRLLQKRESEQRHHRNSAIKTVSKSNKDLTAFSNQVISIVTMAPTTEIEKVRALENLVEEHLKSFDEKKRQRIAKMEALLESLSDQGYFYDLIESQSIKLQRRVSNIVKTIEFSQRSTDEALLKAILHFKQTQGDIGQSPPLEFLTANEMERVCAEESPLRVSLYKSLFFFHITDAIKSGGLIFDSTYRYKGIFDYMIDDITWAEQRDNLLTTAGLEDFNDVFTVLNKLKKQLNGKYRDINQRALQGENRFLSFDKATDKAKVITPKIDNDEFAFIGDILMQAGYVPIQTILSDINTVCHFSACFTHFMNKHNKMKPSLETLMAAIMGIGCNIGVTRIANISIGLNEDTLENTVNWFFSLPNIQSASDRIIEYIDKLSLANAYQFDPEATHTASDGQKYYVAVDSLNAAYSFKYFGKDKGSTVYTFLDEKQSLFYSTVISASEREAAYVIDGLMHNEVVKSHIHSSDSHGYTESIFATMHFIGTAFAPRIKNVGSQTLYGFEPPKFYKDKGYKIFPNRRINTKLIKDNWEDILRFMVTIKLKKSSASQLFSRLSSYAKDIPLYQALKEFGRIMKSHFILTYFDDLELRQRIEKQLNRVELSNKFAKAIFFANNQELPEGLKMEQDIIAGCKMLIQNAIVLWNYLYLSEFLANMDNDQERDEAIASILNGSVLTWRHVNLHGEYDFTREAANDVQFDLNRILSLTVRR